MFKISYLKSKKKLECKLQDTLCIKHRNYLEKTLLFSVCVGTGHHRSMGM